MICASPAYLNKHGRPKKPEDLRSHNCLLFPDMAWRFKYPDRIQEVKVRGNWHSNNGRVLVAAAREGHGLIRFSEYYVKEYIQSGELEVVLEDFEVDDVATWIIYPNRHHLPTRVRYLVEYLLEELPGKTIVI
jgi:DNA-binding transcriptional LysR family regulator